MSSLGESTQNMEPFFKVQTGLQINTKYWWLSGKKFKFI